MSNDSTLGLGMAIDPIPAGTCPTTTLRSLVVDYVEHCEREDRFPTFDDLGISFAIDADDWMDGRRYRFGLLFNGENALVDDGGVPFAIAKPHHLDWTDVAMRALLRSIDWALDDLRDEFEQHAATTPEALRAAHPREI